MNKILGCALVGVVIVIAAGCHHENAPYNNTPSTKPHGTEPAPIASTPSPRTKAVVYVVNPKATGDQDPLMPRTIRLRHPDSPARDAIEALIQSDDSPVAAGTTLRGLVLDNGLAMLDFSRNPVSETGGEGHQSDALTALSRTLGQFPEIRQYQVKVKGQVLTSFGEEGTLNGPIDVIRPDAAPQTLGSAP